MSDLRWLRSSRQRTRMSRLVTQREPKSSLQVRLASDACIAATSVLVIELSGQYVTRRRLAESTRPWRICKGFTLSSAVRSRITFATCTRNSRRLVPVVLAHRRHIGFPVQSPSGLLIRKPVSVLMRTCPKNNTAKLLTCLSALRERVMTL